MISSSNPDLGEAQEELDVDYSGEELAVGSSDAGGSKTTAIKVSGKAVTTSFTA